MLITSISFRENSISILRHINLYASLLEIDVLDVHVIWLLQQFLSAPLTLLSWKDPFRESRWEFIAYYGTPCSTSADEIFPLDFSRQSRCGQRPNDFFFSTLTCTLKLFQFIKSSFRRVVDMQIFLVFTRASSHRILCPYLKIWRTGKCNVSNQKKNGWYNIHRIVSRIKNREYHYKSLISLPVSALFAKWVGIIVANERYPQADVIFQLKWQSRK